MATSRYGADFFAVADLEAGGLPDISNKRKLTERTDDQDYSEANVIRAVYPLILNGSRLLEIGHYMIEMDKMKGTNK